MSRKTVLGAFCASNGAFEVTARRIIAGQQRSFTSTAQRNAQITHFLPTGKPALDELLNTIRHKIILPSYLPLAQRKKIYSPKHEKKLQSDPIIIEIDGEVLKFRHMNPFNGDIPQTRRSVMQAIQLFDTSDDFLNLKPLLEGIAYANRKFDPSFHTKILRVVGAKGRIYDIIDCARSVRRTGFKLDSSEKANEVLHWVQMKAVDSRWDADQTAQALRWAEMVLEMLQDEGHQPRRRKDDPPLDGELPLSRDPMVLAAPLHLAAAMVTRHDAGDEVREMVTKHATDIVRLWPQGRKLKELQPAQLYQDHDKLGYLVEPNKFVVLAAPLLRGLETAIQVVEPQLADQLRSRHDTLAAEVQEAREAGVTGRGGRGEQVYRRVYDLEPLPERDVTVE
ncbi:Uu.00g005580.m01.CDS01 [Anthostomella pinea]|uniref:Uu.00g005580.m01.CDS01 n=1 Tax=Anthostomella pinea TaxID=933095 RepID=A0AAI8VET8_9PEZI|nr:Uu.00g005580.m01.CDS01 [Anthostomella pinea]